MRIAMTCFGQELSLMPPTLMPGGYVWSKIGKITGIRGARLYWLDVAEPEYTYDFSNYRYQLGSVMEVSNIYPKLYTKAFMWNEGGRDENPINLCVRPGRESAKYGAACMVRGY